MMRWFSSDTDGESASELQRQHLQNLANVRTRARDAQRQLAELHAFRLCAARWHSKLQSLYVSEEHSVPHKLSEYDVLCRRKQQRQHPSRNGYVVAADQRVPHSITAGDQASPDNMSQWCAYEARWFHTPASLHLVLWKPCRHMLMGSVAMMARWVRLMARSSLRHVLQVGGLWGRVTGDHVFGRSVAAIGGDVAHVVGSCGAARLHSVPCGAAGLHGAGSQSHVSVW
jgi:hypothetical protein